MNTEAKHDSEKLEMEVDKWCRSLRKAGIDNELSLSELCDHTRSLVRKFMESGYELSEAMRAAGFEMVRGLLAPPYLARRSTLVHRHFRVPASVRLLQDLFLAPIPGLQLRTLVARVFGLNDVLLFANKPS